MKAGVQPSLTGGSSGMQQVDDPRLKQILMKAGVQDQMGGMSAPAAPATPQHPGLQNIIDAPTASSQNVQKGMGSGKNGKRTFGEVLGNVNNGLQDVATGLGKFAIRTVPNVVSALTPDSIWGSDSVFNGESQRHKDFNQAMTGKNAGEKIGATLGDIATLAVPIGEVGRGASLLAERAPQLAEIASKAGTGGKIARFAPKLAGAVAENTLGSAVLGKGNGYDSFGDFAKDSLLAGGVTAGLGALGAGYKAAKFMTEGGKAKVLDEATNYAKQFAQKLEDGTASKFDIGRMRQAESDFKTSLQKLISGTKGRIGKKIDEAIRVGDAKLASTLSDLEDLPDDQIPGVIDTIWEKLGGLGKIGSKGIQGAPSIEGLKSGIAPLADETKRLLGSQQRNMSMDELKAGLRQRLLPNAKSGEEYQQILRDIEDYTESLGSQKSIKNPTSDSPDVLDLFENNKAKRSNLNYQTEDARKQSGRFKKIAAAVDNMLLDPATENGAVGKQLQSEQMKIYDAMNVVKALEAIAPKGILPKWLAQLVGSMGGYAMGGGPATSYAGGFLGGKLAENLNDMAGRLASGGVEGNNVTRSLSQVQSAKKLQTLRSLVDDMVSKNQQVRDEAADTLRKEAAAHKMKLRDFIDYISGNSRLPAPATKPTLGAPEIFPGLPSPKSGAPLQRVNDGSVIHVPPGGFNVKGSLKDYF